MGGVNWIKSALNDGAKGEETDGADIFRGVLALFPLDLGGGGGVDDDTVMVDGFTPVLVGTGPGLGPPGTRLGGELFWLLTLARVLPLLIVLLEDLLPRFVSCISISTGVSCVRRSCMLPRATGELKEDVVDEDTNRASDDFDVG